MKITEAKIKHVATLARLKFSDDEIGKFTAQMNSIINMANQLQAVDTKGVPETVQVVDRKTVLRADQPQRWHQKRDDLMKNVPDKTNGFIKVPVIIAKDGNDQ